MHQHNPIEFHFRNTRLQSRHSGNLVSRVRANSGDFHELRPYVMGEETTRIDYRKSDFENDALIVREYVQEQSYGMAFIFCIDPSWRFGTRELTKFDLISEAITIICESVWEKELPGSFVVVGQHLSNGGMAEYPFPRNIPELRDFLKYLRGQVLSCEEPLSQKRLHSALELVSRAREQMGILLFGEHATETDISGFLAEYQVLRIALVHPAELRISKNTDIPQEILAGPVATRYGARLILSQSDQVWDVLQTAFRLW